MELSGILAFGRRFFDIREDGGNGLVSWLSGRILNILLFFHLGI